MKKALLFALALALLMSCLPMTVFAADEPNVVYYQNFDEIKSFSELGWEVSNNLTTSTVQYGFENGRLIVDNLDATVVKGDVAKGIDSYAYILKETDLTKELIKEDYTIQYDMEYLEADESKRYSALIFNYNGKDTYNSVHIRVCGYGNNQSRINGTWYTYDTGANGVHIATQSDSPTKSLISRVFDTPINVNDYGLKNKKMTVRIEVSKEKGPTTYVNGIVVSTPVDTSKWGTFHEFSAIAIKTSQKIKAAIDNIYIYKGIGTEPILPKPVVEEPEDNTPTGKPAETGDMLFILPLIAIISALVAQKVRKIKSK